MSRPSGKKAVTARICTLYGDFSAISDGQFLVLGPGRLCTKLLLVLGSLLEMVLAGWLASAGVVGSANWLEA